MTAVAWAALPLQHAVSRAHERRADRAALDLTRNVEAFVSAMRRLGTRNLAEPSPSLLTRLLFHTHPPVDERIASAADWASAQARRGDGGQPATADVRGGAA
jgi:STE24 endopeptidase